MQKVVPHKGTHKRKCLYTRIKVASIYEISYDSQTKDYNKGKVKPIDENNFGCLIGDVFIKWNEVKLHFFPL